MEGSAFNVLPYEVIVQILIRVPMASFNSVSSTCNYWRSILSRREFWKFLAQLLWGENSIPSSDVANNPISTVPVISGNLIDWRAYVKIRSEIDGIAGIMNVLKKDFAPIDLNADLDNKIDVIASNLHEMPSIFEDKEQAALFLTLVVSCCQSTFGYRKNAFGLLEHLPSNYFLSLAVHKRFWSSLLKITAEAISMYREAEPEQCLEFWSGVCDQELDYRENSDKTSSAIIDHVLNELVPLLIGAISDKKYMREEDNDDWNVRKAAEVCLQLVTSVATNKIGPLIDPLLQRDLYSEDWARQEVAITILGLILTEEHYDYIEEKLPSIVPQVLALLRHTNVNVRSSAAFTLRCICNGYASSIGEHKKAVVQTILGSVRDEDRVRRHIYTCIINAESEDLFEQDFSQLAHALVESLGAPNADIPVIFEAIASLVNAQENIDPIKPLVPFILQSLQQNFDDAVVVATAVIRKLKQDLEPYADQFMSLYIARFPNNVSEEVLMAIGYTAQAAGERFAKYLPSLMPLILPLLADVQQPQIFGPTLGVFIDIFQNTKGAISPYCDTIMNALLFALQAPDVDPQYKPEALSLLGDIAAGIGGGAYEKYMPQVQQVLTQAGHVILGQNNLEDEQHIALQQYLISTWTSLFQNFHHNPAILMENLPQILQVIIKTVQGYQNTQDAANAVYLVGDILQCCNQAKVYISALPELQNCLGLACNSTNKTVTAAAEWVLQLMNNKL